MKIQPCILSCVHAIFLYLLFIIFCLKALLYTGMFICGLFVPILKAPCQKGLQYVCWDNGNPTSSYISNETTNKAN